MAATRAVFTLERLERHPGPTFAAIGLVFAAAYLLALTLFPHGRIVDGDTVQYYAYLRSLAIDHDLDFDNDYRLLYAPAPEGGAGTNIWLTSSTPIGRRPNLMSIGPALLWSPFFFATYAALAVLRVFGLAVPLDGIAAPFPLSAGVAGVAYAAAGAYLCYRACRLIAPGAAAFWAALAAWLATPAVYYSLVSPSYSHAPSMFASALFCWAWLRSRDDERVGRFAVLGLLAGLAALVRWQDVVIAALPAIELLRAVVRRRTTWLAAAGRAAVMAAAIALMLVPQMLAWHAIYGQFVLVPQGGAFMRWGSPAVLPVLGSLKHGLFTWTPAVLVAAAGLVLLARREPFPGGSLLAVLLVAIYVNASVSDWWAGEAFGARRFVSDTVLFAIGFAALFDAAPWRDRPWLVRWTAVALSAYNLLFVLQYELFMRGFRSLAPYPATWREVLVDRLLLPWHLLARWL
ncbi:MAG TPA: hypothetical protein VL309_04810 [Vicinamibacterales bacterium]|nr:hypothetical protein [Vicinamibacterales bacterium]